MKRFRYDYTAINRILPPPFTLEYEQINVYNNLQTSLPVLFPLKSTFYLQKNPGIFSVSLLPDAPFGPEPDVFIDSLFTDFSQALLEVKKFFGLSRIELISPDDRSKDRAITWSKKITRKHETGILLDVFEFYKLYTAAITGQHVKSVFMSIFIDKNSTCCFQVSEGMSIKNILQHLETDYSIQPPPESKLFHPVLRREIDPEKATTDNQTSLLMFTHSGYTIAPDGNFLFSFPYFSHKIGLRKRDLIEKELLPCTNCLACATYCPSGLFPSYLYHNSIHGRQDETLGLNIHACIQCGKCNFVCPASLPLCETITQTMKELKEE